MRRLLVLSALLIVLVHSIDFSPDSSGARCDVRRCAQAEIFAGACNSVCHGVAPAACDATDIALIWERAPQADGEVRELLAGCAATPCGLCALGALSSETYSEHLSRTVCPPPPPGTVCDRSWARSVACINVSSAPAVPLCGALCAVGAHYCLTDCALHILEGDAEYWTCVAACSTAYVRCSGNCGSDVACGACERADELVEDTYRRFGSARAAIVLAALLESLDDHAHSNAAAIAHFQCRFAYLAAVGDDSVLALPPLHSLRACLVDDVCHPTVRRRGDACVEEEDICADVPLVPCGPEDRAPPVPHLTCEASEESARSYALAAVVGVGSTATARAMLTYDEDAVLCTPCTFLVGGNSSNDAVVVYGPALLLFDIWHRPLTEFGFDVPLGAYRICRNGDDCGRTHYGRVYALGTHNVTLAHDTPSVLHATFGPGAQIELYATEACDSHDPPRENDCRVRTRCALPWGGDDGCVADVCVGGMWPTHSHVQCDDGDPCTVDWCGSTGVAGQCFSAPRPAPLLPISPCQQIGCVACNGSDDNCTRDEEGTGSYRFVASPLECALGPCVTSRCNPLTGNMERYLAAEGAACTINATAGVCDDSGNCLALPSTEAETGGLSPGAIVAIVLGSVVGAIIIVAIVIVIVLGDRRE